MHTLFQIRNLSVRVQDKTLLEIDQLDIPSGMTVIIGPNGAGKSTLLRALIGQTGQGGITLFGEAVTPQIRAGRVAWVGQHGRYNMPMTVREYIALASFVQKGRLNHEWADELLDYFDLMALADKRIGKLSGGEQQRVCIARALVNQPPVIFADEPTGNLDSRTSSDVMGLLKRTSTEFNQTIVMITHNSEIAQLADRIVRIEDGKIIG